MSKGTLNKAVLIGNLGRDPDVKSTEGGLKIANFSIATQEINKNKETTTDWHQVTVFGKLAEIVEQYVKKGHKVYVEGKIQYRKWTDKTTGQEKLGISIIADELQMLGGGKADAPQTSASDAREEFYNDPITF